MNAMTSLEAMRQDLRDDVEILRGKRRIIRCLERLPDDDARRRAIIAAAVLLGHQALVMRAR